MKVIQMDFVKLIKQNKYNEKGKVMAGRTKVIDTMGGGKEGGDRIISMHHRQV